MTLVKLSHVSDGTCPFGQGDAWYGRNSDTNHSVWATIRASTDFPYTGYPYDEVKKFTAGEGNKRIGCGKIPDKPITITYTVVGEEIK